MLDHAYHGHLRSTIALSPYKFNGSATGRPRTHVAALPTEPGALESLRAQIDAPAAFFAESLQGCGGQIVYPPGYLTRGVRGGARGRRACASPTRSRPASAASASTSGASSSTASCRTSSRSASRSATATRSARW